MATIAKDGLFAGTTLIRGVTSNNPDNATRVIHVTDLPDTTAALQTAINTAYAYAPGAFPGTTIPLKTMQFVPSSGTTGRVFMRYSRNQSVTPPPDPIAVARFSFVEILQPWYSAGSSFTSEGQPNGAIAPNHVKNNPLVEPSPWNWPVSIMRLYVPWVLTYNPVDDVRPCHMKINNDSITFGDSVFAPYTMRFDGLEVNWLTTNTGDTFVGNYVFSHRRDGWYYQRLSNSSNAWTATVDANTRQYGSIAFAGAFPYA